MGERELATVVVRDEDGIVDARSYARDAARQLGFGMVDQSRITTAVSELARNVVRYATPGEGEAIFREIVSEDGRTGIEIVVRDNGPGIFDIRQAMGEGFTSGSGMGLGLPGTKRLMDEFEIESTVGAGTTVTVRKWRR
jgi:serine/threonine-protein kinase RsbT